MEKNQQVWWPINNVNTQQAWIHQRSFEVFLRQKTFNRFVLKMAAELWQIDWHLIWPIRGFHVLSSANSQWESELKERARPCSLDERTRQSWSSCRCGFRDMKQWGEAERLSCSCMKLGANVQLAAMRLKKKTLQTPCTILFLIYTQDSF